MNICIDLFEILFLILSDHIFENMICFKLYYFFNLEKSWNINKKVDNPTGPFTKARVQGRLALGKTRCERKQITSHNQLFFQKTMKLKILYTSTSRPISQACFFNFRQSTPNLSLQDLDSNCVMKVFPPNEGRRRPLLRSVSRKINTFDQSLNQSWGLQIRCLHKISS